MDINESVEIKFVGKNNTIFNVVSYGQFERVYKPKGWVLKDDSILKESKTKKKEQPIKEATQEEKKADVVEELKLEEQPVEKIVEELKTTDETEIKNINNAKKKADVDVEFNDKIMKE